MSISKLGTQHVINRCNVEDAENWVKWVQEIPRLKFPSSWEVKVIPPFGGAIVRFQVFKGGKNVSVYLDCYDRLGIFGAPYWEIYPYEGDTYRCPMLDVKDLIYRISQSLRDTRGKKS